ncbi:serum/glucocorticoid regulated kinase 1 [Cricetulus griseus]
MQGALARARLESLLRPRHKKRAEAQKRSESVLLSGLGKHRRPARGDSAPEGYGWVEVGWRREDGAAQDPADASRAPGRESEEGRVPSFCPGGRRPSVPLSPGPARTALEPSALPGRSAQLTQDQAASHPHPPGSRSAVAVAAGGGASSTLTYSRMRGMVAILIAFMKQRRMGLNDFIQKIANNSYACKHPEVQSILKISQPQEPELMNANPSPPVLLARHKAEEAFYAVKVLQKKAILKKKEEKHIMSERNVLLKNVKHPFLVGLHFSFQTADKLYFVLDYINGGELFYHLQRERCFLEPRARFYAAEIASALGYLHSLNIVYRDLKPENILLDSQGHIVLTDFGLCKENIEHNGTTSTFCGTPEYLAPEVLHKQPYDRTVDWWCLGAVLYEMLYGLPPFYSRNTAEMYDNILNKPLQLKPNITNSARHLLEGLLQKDRTKRLGAKEDFSGPSDLRHFDPEFTEEPVPNSIGRSPDSILITASVKEAAEAFLGFSYAPPMDSFL